MSDVLIPTAEPDVSATPPSTESGRTPKAGWAGRLVNLLPSVLALAAVAGLVLFGQSVGWKMPKFSSLTGRVAAEEDDWCAEHSVPESTCVECGNESSAARKPLAWCKAHGVPECPLCHPEIAQLVSPPTVTPEMLTRAEAARAFADRVENSSKCKLHQRRLQFASLEAFRKSGMQVAHVGVGLVSETVAAPGEVVYDPTRVARLSPRLAGTVWRVEKKVGDRVREGEVLALVDAADVGKAKSAFLQALFQVELKRKTLEGLNAASASVREQSIREAEAALEEAKVQLVTAGQALTNLGMPASADRLRGLEPAEASRRVQFLGLPAELVATLDRTASANLLPVVAPLDGVIVSREREAVAGESVEPGRALFVVADTSRMWLQLDLRLEDARRVKVGQAVRFKSDGGPLLTASLAWVSTAVDEQTRTVRARAELDNTNTKLRARTFGSGTVVLREEKDAVVVPSEAVHWEGCCHVVFVRDKHFENEGAPKVFHVRKILPGARAEEKTEVIAGVLPGELVATRGSGLLRAELLKNNLGAG
ncbi:MAG: efflux RND transporter periplasmic adaptor subunit [Gemmataceae bacterium]